MRIKIPSDANEQTAPWSLTNREEKICVLAGMAVASQYTYRFGFNEWNDLEGNTAFANQLVDMVVEAAQRKVRGEPVNVIEVCVEIRAAYQKHLGFA